MEKVETSTRALRSYPANTLEAAAPPSTQEEQVSQNVQCMYCKELVYCDGMEFSFEELRAKRYYKQVNEKVVQLSKVKEELKFQIEQKQKLVQERNNTTQHQEKETFQMLATNTLNKEPNVSHSTQNTSAPVPLRTTFQKNFQAPDTSNDSYLKNGQTSQDEDMGQAFKQGCTQESRAFIIHNENALPEKPNLRSSSMNHKSLKLPTGILKARQPAPTCPSDKDASVSRSEEAIINGHWNKTLCRSPDDTCDFVRAAQLASTPFGGQIRPNLSDKKEAEVSSSDAKSVNIQGSHPEPIAEPNKLSPIQEISREWATSFASTAPGEPEAQGKSTTSGIMESMQPSSGKNESTLVFESSNATPCSQEVRKSLLDNVDLSSFVNFSRMVGPLPEFNDLQLGDETLVFLEQMEKDLYHYYSDSEMVFVKVDETTEPWDFYISSRLQAGLPTELWCCHTQISCHLYENGSVTLWRCFHAKTIKNLVDERMQRRDVCLVVIHLLEMVKQMHACRLVHGDLRPERLMVCCSCEHRVSGFEFSSSLDLELQTEVKSVQGILSAQKYLNQGVLLPSDSPYQVDLCAVAEIVHLLLVGRSMEPVKEGSYWRVGAQSGQSESLDSMWEAFFNKLLNPEDKSTVSILSELINNLKNLA